MRNIIVFAFLTGIVLLLAIVWVRRILLDKLYQSPPPLRVRDNPFTDCYLYVNDRKVRWTLHKRPPNRDCIHVWYLDAFPERPVVLYFHGNSNDISRRMFMVDICVVLRVNLLLVEYRGFGKSPGDPSPTNMLVDATTAYNFLREFHEPEEIVVWGESLGGTPALHVAAHHQVSGLVLWSTFSTLEGLLPPEYGMLNEFVKAACSDIMDRTRNLDLARRVKCATLLLHSPDDTLIPYAHAKELKATLRESTLLPLKGDHASPHVTEDTIRTLGDYLRVDITPETAATIVTIIRAAR